MTFDFGTPIDPATGLPEEPTTWVALGGAYPGVTHQGYVGDGYLEWADAPGDGAAMVTIDSEYAGVLPMTIRYAAGLHTTPRGLDQGDRSLTLQVAQTNHQSAVFFAEMLVPNVMDPWANWGEQIVHIPVAAGANVLSAIVDDHDLGFVNLDEFRWDRCGAVVTANEPPKLSSVTDQLEQADAPIDIRFQITDDGPLTSLTVQALGLPPELSVVPINVSTGEWAIVGDAGPAYNEYQITIVVTDAGAPQLSGSGGFLLVTDHFGQSPVAGQLVFTEVLYRQGTDFLDEAIEIRNLGPGNVDLDQYRLVDHHLFVDPPDAGSLNYRFDSVDEYLDRGTILQVGQRAFITMAHPEDVDMTVPAPCVPGVGCVDISVNLGSFELTNADLQFPAVPSGTGQANSWSLNNAGDGVWLLDKQGDLVAYVAWGSYGQPGSALGAAPSHHHNIWNADYQPDLLGTPATHSISLATDGPNAGLSACWEHNATGQAIARNAAGPPDPCPDPKAVTVRDGPVQNVDYAPPNPPVDLSGLFPGRSTSLGMPNIQ